MSVTFTEFDGGVFEESGSGSSTVDMGGQTDGIDAAGPNL